MWWVYALLSALFAALTAIFAKVGVANINSNLATGLSWIFYFKALQLGNVTEVAMVDKLSIALTIVLAATFLGEAITFRTAAAALLIISGTLLLVVK